MTWPQLSPKQLVSISHATPDLIPQPGTIRNPDQKKKKIWRKIFNFFLKRKKFRNMALYGLRLVAPSQCGLFGQKKKVLSLTQLHVN